MKVIDLLNKLYNMEEVPEKIKIGCSHLTLNKNKDNYIYENRDEYYGDELIHWYDLDTKVEVIEEKEETKPTTKEIEALGYACGEIQKCFTNGWNKSLKNEPLIEEDKKIEKIDVNHLQQIKKWKRAKVLGNKINEIIDYINGSDKE